MLKETIQVIFERHDIPLDDIDMINKKIDSIILDNPSILYPQNRKNGIFEMDWVNSIMYFREHRKDVQFDDRDRVEISFEFDNIQRILFKLEQTDYENDLLPGTTETATIVAINAYTLTKAQFDNHMKSLIISNYADMVNNEILRLSNVNDNSILSDLDAYDSVIDNISERISVINLNSYTDMCTKITEFKNKTIDKLDELLLTLTTEQIMNFVDKNVYNSITILQVDDLFHTDKGVDISSYVKTYLLEIIDTFMLDIKHETYLLSEVKLKINTDTKMDAEVEFSIPEPPVTP